MIKIVYKNSMVTSHMIDYKALIGWYSVWRLKFLRMQMIDSLAGARLFRTRLHVGCMATEYPGPAGAWGS